MLKKVRLLLSGTLILVASSLYYINFSPQHTSTSKTYQYKKNQVHINFKNCQMIRTPLLYQLLVVGKMIFQEWIMVRF